MQTCNRKHVSAHCSVDVTMGCKCEALMACFHKTRFRRRRCAISTRGRGGIHWKVPCCNQSQTLFLVLSPGHAKRVPRPSPEMAPPPSLRSRSPPWCRPGRAWLLLLVPVAEPPPLTVAPGVQRAVGRERRPGQVAGGAGGGAAGPRARPSGTWVIDVEDG